MTPSTQDARATGLVELAEAQPCTMGVGCDEAGVCYAEANGSPSMCPHAPCSDFDKLRKALAASLAKRSVPMMDPPYTAAFNAALDMVERDTASALAASTKDMNHDG